MTSITEKLRLIEALVRTPVYGVVGYTHEHLVYSSTVEGTVDLWSLNPRTGETVRLTVGGIHSTAPIRSSSPLVVYTRDVSRGRELQQVFIVDARGGEERGLEGMKPRRVLGVGFDGKRVALAAATGRMMELWILEPGNGAEKVHEIGALLFVTDYNDDRIVGQGIFRGDPRAFELFIYDVRVREFKVYTPKEGSVNKNPKVKGDKLLFATTAFGDEKLVVYDLAKNELEEPELAYRDYEKYEFTEYVNFDWTEDGRIWFIGKREGRTRLFVDGREVPLPRGFSTRAVVVGDRVYVSHSSLTTPTRIYEVKPEGARVVLGAQLPEEVASRLGRAYLVKYKSFDGLEIPAYVIESRAASKPGPTIVYVHGGPWSEVADYWSSFIASLVVSGYHVIAPNFRGSTGYGEEFRRLDIGDPGGGDLMDVVYAAEWVRENGLASKVAIMGYSYGGFMTFLATVKEPGAWDAGVAGAGIVDWEEMYGLSDAFFKKFIDVLFNGKRELWRDRSATNFVENLRVPLCILHPQNDSRTPLKPVLHYVEKLLERGKTFELHVVPDAGHAIRRIDDVLKILMPAITFLDRYLSERQ